MRLPRLSASQPRNDNFWGMTRQENVLKLFGVEKMSNIPHELQYTKTHEWLRKDEDMITIGITDHAQTMLGDLVYVELPEIESNLNQGQECAVVESVKAAADIYSPISGEVMEVNMAVIENPQLINQDPYGRGWLFRVKPYEQPDIALLTANDYSKVVASEAH
jgi:glycine cleavage system H protein